MSAWCKNYIGIPFTDFGRDFAGCDCWGLVRLVYRNEIGIELPSFLGEYDSTTDISKITILHDCERMQWEQVKDPNELDLASLRIQGRPWHVGIVVDSKRILHALKGCGTVLEPFAPMWSNRIDGFFRWKKR